MSEEIMNIGSAEGDQVLELDINRLRAFKNHPFKVTADMSMVELKDSIEKYGILNPLIVRPRPEGVYEIISGHRRKYAAERLGYRKVPVIIRAMKDDEAVVSMVDSNLQRERISPSEKAFAYKMKLEALDRQGEKPTLCPQDIKPVDSATEIAESAEESQTFIDEVRAELVNMGYDTVHEDNLERLETSAQTAAEMGF